MGGLDQIGAISMSELNSIVNVHEQGQREPIAKIILNGYNIDVASSFAHVGAMRSFKILAGEETLIDYWRTQMPLQIDDGQGNTRSIRIYAAPSQLGGLGFVEFL